MKGKATTLVIILLACFSLFNFVNNSQIKAQYADLKATVKDNPSKIVYVQAKDGKTPIKGIDYFDGKNGINAVSFSVQNTIIKEVPLIGEKGDKGDSPECLQEASQCRGSDGKDAPIQEIRINPDNGDLETKQSDWSFWNTLIPCSKLQIGCPNVQ